MGVRGWKVRQAMVDTGRPPVAKRIPHTTRLHGRTVDDPYRWLQDRDAPEVQAYLEAENAWTERCMADTVALQQRLFNQMVARIKETDSTVPYVEGEYHYYMRTEAGRQYAKYCRRHGSMSAPEEVILDVDALAEGYDYYELGLYEVSPDGRWLAYSEDVRGDEHYTLRIKDLSTGRLLPEVIENTADSAEWCEDGQSLYYTVLDDLVRPYRLYRHRLGTPVAHDELICEETDERYHLSVSKSLSRRYLFIGATCSSVTEFHYMPADGPTNRFHMLFPRQEGVRYYPEHHAGEFLILTNEDAKDFRLMAVPCHNVDRAAWRAVIPHRAGCKIEFVYPFADHLCSFEREDGLDRIRVHTLATGEIHTVDMPDSVYSIDPGHNPRQDTRNLRFAYSSPIRPDSVYDYDLVTRTRTLLKVKVVPSGHDPERYRTDRLMAPSADGTAVPVTVLHRRDVILDGKNPCLLYGYGANGVTIDPRFRSPVYNYVDRGFVYAIAHVRGGGLLGERWYEDGKVLHKQNSFADFIAAATHLVDQGYTCPDKLAIEGGSAGGLLVGAVVNERPELFRAAVAEVPFVDVVTTMLDSSIPLTVTEYDQWGNPHDLEYFEYMLSYDPYSNVRTQAYPHMLVTAGLNDPRVQYWQPVKWVAKLRALGRPERELLLKVNLGAGHQGASGRYDYLKEHACIQAFILKYLGVAESVAAEAVDETTLTVERY